MPEIPGTWDGQDSQGNPLRFDSGLTWDSLIQQPSTPSRKMPAIHVIVGFDNFTDNNIFNLATAVSAGFYGSAAFPNPPATLPSKPVFDAANSAFGLSIAAAKAGGPAATADKDNKRAALIALLRQLAAYVQANCNNDPAVVLSTGFKVGKTTRTPASELESVPHIRSITNGATGQFIIHIDPVPNNHGFDVRLAPVGPGGVLGPYQSGGHFTDSRSMVVSNLIPGTLYSVEVCAHLGGNRTTGWSDGMQHMSL